VESPEHRSSDREPTAAEQSGVALAFVALLDAAEPAQDSRSVQVSPDVAPPGQPQARAESAALPRALALHSAHAAAIHRFGQRASPACSRVLG